MRASLNTYSIQITEKEYRMLADFIYSKSGIRLGEEKKELLKARLMKRMRFHHFHSWRDYYDYVCRDASGQELVAMLDAISTNVTQFFREKAHFDFLRDAALPKIFAAKEKRKEHVLRIWSTAVSTGEEIYSILMTVLEVLKDSRVWTVKALGTDISTKVLAVAQKAVYPIERLKGLPLSLMDKYFSRESEGEREVFRLKEAVRRLVIFRRANLVTDPFPFRHKFDIIFCRNVMIYFDKPTQASLVNKLGSCLHDDGFLFIGHSESLIGVKTRLVNVAPAIYRKA